LQEKYIALASSLILYHGCGICPRSSFGILSGESGIGTHFLVSLFATALTFVHLIYNNTNRSTLAVILFHSMVNFTGELFTLSERADTYSILLWFVAAIGITVIWSAKTFTVRKEAYS
jgi:hypothetical protein